MSQLAYCGRAFSTPELELLQELCQRLSTRRAIALELCRLVDWHDLMGKPKFISASVAIRRMEADGLLTLPAQANCGPAGKWPLFLPPEPPPPAVNGALAELTPLRLRAVIAKSPDSPLWNRLLAQHHYLGYRPLVGAQRRYLIESHDHTILGLIAIAAAAWTCQPRDKFIGWDHDQRRANLRLVVGNTRFLILPWVRVPHLASCSLGLLARSIGIDWEQTYGFQPALLETFVETARFRGTSYKAANWILAGRTQGRGKLDVRKQRPLPVKDIYLYPLGRHFRQRLTAP
jgi:hypothetical protein